MLCSVLRTQSAHRLSLQHLAVVPTPNIAELVHSVFVVVVVFFFSVHKYGFCGGPNTFSQEKHRVYLDRAAIDKKLSLSINCKVKINFWDIADVSRWSSPFPINSRAWVRFSDFCSPLSVSHNLKNADSVTVY